MAAPRKFDAETRAPAVRMYRDRLRDHDESKTQGDARSVARYHEPMEAFETRSRSLACGD
jgi:hypothetical protein